MIKLTQIPVATATTASYLVEIEENVCRAYCVGSSIQPTATVSFSVADTSVLAGTAIATVNAQVTIVTPSSNGCGCAHTQVITEKFEIPFAFTGNNLITVTQEGTATTPSKVKCCKAKAVKITSVINAVIA